VGYDPKDDTSSHSEVHSAINSSKSSRDVKSSSTNRARTLLSSYVVHILVVTHSKRQAQRKAQKEQKRVNQTKSELEIEASERTAGTKQHIGEGVHQKAVHQK
jgi:hypothetical protein